MEQAQKSPPPAMMPDWKLDNYGSARGATAYKSDWDAKLHRRVSNRREQRIYAQLLAEIGHSRSLLDLPSGHGRLFPMLAAHADRVIEGDWSFTMLGLNARDHDRAAAGYVRCSALEIPLADRVVETVFSIRLSHHFDRQEDREQHLREVMRVADRWVVVTFFSFHSLKNALRRLRAPFNRKRAKNTLRTARVAEVAADCGYRMVRTLPLSRLGSGHVFALLQRQE